MTRKQFTIDSLPRSPEVVVDRKLFHPYILLCSYYNDILCVYPMLLFYALWQHCVLVQTLTMHDIINFSGRTLLRLNATKLQSLGVTTPAHWYNYIIVVVAIFNSYFVCMSFPGLWLVCRVQYMLTYPRTQAPTSFATLHEKKRGSLVKLIMWVM